MISDRGHDQDGTIDYLWIGFNSDSNWQNFSTLRSQGHSNWIGGRVIVDTENPLGFYFDPNTTEAGEVTAEGQQTTLDAIKQSPSYFAGFSWNWYVTPATERVL